MRGKKRLQNYMAVHANERVILAASSRFHAQTVAMARLEQPPRHTWQIDIIGPLHKRSPYINVATRFTSKHKPK